jgi:hypothetical protein
MRWVLGSPIGWPPCRYESVTPMPPVLMPGERTGRLCHREANGRQRPNKGLMAPAAALTAQSEQRPPQAIARNGKKLVPRSKGSGSTDRGISDP